MNLFVPLFPRPNNLPSYQDTGTLIGFFYIIDATLNDFLGIVALNYGTLWVSTIPYIALENAHVLLKRIHLMQEYRAHAIISFTM